MQDVALAARRVCCALARSVAAVAAADERCRRRHNATAAAAAAASATGAEAEARVGAAAAAAARAVMAAAWRRRRLGRVRPSHPFPRPGMPRRTSRARACLERGVTVNAGARINLASRRSQGRYSVVVRDLYRLDCTWLRNHVPKHFKHAT